MTNSSIIRWIFKSAVVLLMPVMVLTGVRAASQVVVPLEFMEVQVHEVLRDPRTAQPVVILTDTHGHRAMPIWIGEAEARALEAARFKVTHRRPMTHDLLTGILEKLNARPTQVRITELRENIYYARIFLDVHPKQMQIDARPSDAMVLALRAGCPIMVATSLFEAQSAILKVSSVGQYGLEVQELTEDLKAAMGFHGEGILIAQVEPGSKAAHDGLLRGDILVQVTGTPLSRVEDLEKTMGGSESDLNVRVYRRGSFISMTLHPQESP